MISSVFDLFTSTPAKPTFDLFLTYVNVFIGRLLLLKARVFLGPLLGEGHVTKQK